MGARGRDRSQRHRLSLPLGPLLRIFQSPLVFGLVDRLPGSEVTLQQRPIGELPDITSEVAASTSGIAWDRAAGMSHACQSIKAARVIQPSSEPSKRFAKPTRP